MAHPVTLAEGLQSWQRAAGVAVRMGATRAVTCTSTHSHRWGRVQASCYAWAAGPPRTPPVPGGQHRVLLRRVRSPSRAGAGPRGAVHPPVGALLWRLHASSVVVRKRTAKAVALHMTPHGGRFSGTSWPRRGERRAVAADSSVLALRPQTWQTAWGWWSHGGSGGVHWLWSHPSGLRARPHVLTHSTHCRLPRWTDIVFNH